VTREGLRPEDQNSKEPQMNAERADQDKTFLLVLIRALCVHLRLFAVSALVA